MNELAQINGDSDSVHLLKELQSLHVKVNSRACFRQVVRIARKRNYRCAIEIPAVKPISGVIICGDKSWEDFFPYSCELDEVVPHVIYNTSNAGSVSTSHHTLMHIEDLIVLLESLSLFRASVVVTKCHLLSQKLFSSFIAIFITFVFEPF